MEAQVIRIDPESKPRMTRSDKWYKPKDYEGGFRPCVLKYRAYKDRLNELAVELSESGQRVIFILPLRKSYSKKKRNALRGQPHQIVPDTDNMLKALWDSLLKQDCRLWHTEVLKIWGDEGMIIIEDRPPIDLTPYRAFCTKD